MTDYTDLRNAKCRYCGSRLISDEMCDCRRDIGECPVCGGDTWNGKCMECDWEEEDVCNRE